MAQTREELATAIFDITHQCLDSFNQIAAKQDESLLTRPFVPGDDTDSSRNRSHSSRDFLGLRNSFSFWIDFTGALSLMDSSLDTRLRGLTDISSMVIELLEMILRNLQRLDRPVGGPLIGSSDLTTRDSKELQSVISRWENASRAIDSVLDRLHFLAAAIRKASAKRLEYNVATFLTDDDILFRRDAASLVRWRFPSARKGLSQQLGDSIAVRRRMLLQKHRHAKKLAVRRIVENTLPVRQSEDTGPHPRPTASPPAKDKIVHHLNVPESGITRASRPDPQAPVLRHLHLYKRPALTSVISTISIAPGDSFEYPQPPKIKEGETRIQCPYCLMPVDLRRPMSQENKDWRHHVDEDLRPFVCLFPECAEALVFFAHRHEWESHMESVHSRDWPRRVHTITWYCDIDHNPPEQFETELQWRKHMENLDSHPKRQLAEPTSAQLDALSPTKQQVALREQFVCPLCEQIPEKIRHLTEKGNENPKMYQLLVEHVANHIKSLSLLSLPCLDTTPAPLDTDGESIAIKDSFRRLMNPGSVPQQPSGIEHLDTASLPPEAWSVLDRENIATLTTPLPESAWDKEYPDYVHPDDIPELLADEWVEIWKTWKEERDPLAQESIDFDPIISHLRNSKISDIDAQATAHTAALEDADVNSKDAYGRTQLSHAAEHGHEAVVKLLLEKGADIESKNSESGQTPLSWAARNGHEAVVKLLLEKGANIESKHKFGQTPLSWAAENGHEAGQTPLSWAAENGHEAVVKLLLEKGANIESKDEFGQTPLSRAAENGHEAVTRLLLEKGANTEPKDEFGQTPLSRAAESGHEAVTRLLLEKGANTESKHKFGQTPLSLAAKSGREAVTRLLLEKGANIESKHKSGQTPLSLAAESGHEAVTRLLLEKGANTESKDKFGQTPLSRAAKSGHEAVTRLLLEKGTSKNSVYS